MRKCDVCGNESFHARQVDESFHIDGQLVMVEGIPAHVCGRCGDATFDRQTTEAVRGMLHGDSRPTRHMNVDVFAFAEA